MTGLKKLEVVIVTSTEGHAVHRAFPSPFEDAVCYVILATNKSELDAKWGWKGSVVLSMPVLGLMPYR